MMRHRWAVSALTLSLFAGFATVQACSSADPSSGGTDAGDDGAGGDSSAEAGKADGSTDAAKDGTVGDATTDAAKDGSGDGSRDGSGDGGGEGGRDGASDGASDATTDSGDAGSDAAMGDGGDASDGASAQVERGRYLVQNLLVCADCHTPMNNMGMPDFSRAMAGGMDFPIPNPAVDGGLDHVYAGNLTSDPTTGIGNWTVAELKAAMLQGVDRAGNALFPIMPYHELGNMTDADATAIALYLKSIPPIVNAVPESTIQLPAPEPVFAESSIPHTTLPSTDPNFQKAEDGRYLAKLVCLHCHTPDMDVAGPPVTDLSRAFGGGRSFQLGPSFTSVSANITPHAGTGLAGWTITEIENTLKSYLKKGTGAALCAPMPPTFSGLTATDITNIATYIGTLPPVDNVAPGVCPGP